MKIILLLLIVMPTIIHAQEKVILSEESDYIKRYLIEYLIANGSAESVQDTTYLFTRQLFKTGVLEEGYCVFSFGLMETHAKEYIYLKNNSEIEILDLSDIGESLMRLGMFFRNGQICDEKGIKLIIDEMMRVINKNKFPLYKSDN